MGLLLLRAAIASAFSFSSLQALVSGRLEPITARLVAILLAMLLLFGFRTRITCMTAVAFELFGVYSHLCEASPSIFLCVLIIALALLGPGSWSLDARLSGWKRISIPPRHQ